jgi:hypothetical protein
MKNRTMICTVAAFACAGLTPTLAADIKAKVKCTEVIAHLENEIVKEPTRVLLAVEDALNANSACSCEIIKTAITTSRADHNLVGEIVSTAINTLPTSASTIAECALTASPDAAKEIKAAMQTILGEGDGMVKVSGSKESSGKEPIAHHNGGGKAPITVGREPITMPTALADPDPEDSGIGAHSVDIQGIYLAVPSSRGTATKIVEKTVVKIVHEIKKIPFYVPLYVPATKS